MFFSVSSELSQWITPEAKAKFGLKSDSADHRDELLATVESPQLFGDHQVVDASMADCCRAGILLLHHFLDESHEYSQRIKTPEGSYWHGIMHRLEGDFSNAKYWFRNVGRHPTDPMLAVTAATLSSTSNDARLLQLADEWDSGILVDIIQEDSRSGENWVQALQSRQWELLFVYCYAFAVGLPHPWK